MSNIAGICALTPSQEGMFLQTRICPGSRAYHLQYVLRIDFQADMGLMERSVLLLAERHEVLKSAFVMLSSSASVKQLILKDRKPDMRRMVFQTPFDDEKMREILEKDVEEPFDLVNDPLFRVTFVLFADQKLLVISAHHLILDGWSLLILSRDLDRLYSSLEQGTDPEEMLLRIQEEKERSTPFGAYSKWLNGQRTEEAFDYWSDLLRNCGLASDLPNSGVDSDGTRWMNESHRVLAHECGRDAERFARKHAVSVNTVFEAAFARLLRIYTGREKAVFGKIISGRSVPIPDIENTVGPFINMIPVCADFDENTGTAGLMKKIQEQSILASQYGFLPLSKLYARTGLRQNHLRILFVFNNYFYGGMDRLMQTRLQMELVSYRDQTEFDLTVSVLKVDGDYRVAVSYSPERYAPAQIEDMLAGFERELQECVSEKDGEEPLAGPFAGGDIGIPAASGTEELSVDRSAYEPPRSETERQICALFEDVLQIETVGRADNFYDIGGTSLDMMYLLCRHPLESVRPSDFMEDPTPVGLAALLEEQRERSLLSPLYLPEEIHSAYVLFSYGGGDASAFTALVAEFRRRKTSTALYYMPWLEESDYDAAANQIRRLAEKMRIRFYSHCAGAVTAMKLLERLNGDKRVVEEYFAAANIPPARGRRPVNLWRAMTNDAILLFLQKAGLPVEEFSKERKRTVIERFRRDTDEYYRFFNGKTGMVSCRLTILLGKNDIFTRRNKKAKSRWGEYAEEIGEVFTLDSQTHYFQSRNAGELVDILLLH